MNSTTEFRPSNVHQHTVLVGKFGRAEQEVAAMYVTNFLSSKDANWDAEFTWHEFALWLKDNLQSVNEFYVTMLRINRGPQFVVNGIHQLVDNRHMTRREANGETHFTVTRTFVDVMRKCV